MQASDLDGLIARLREAELKASAVEARLFEAEAKYESLVQQLPCAIYVDSAEPDGPTYYVSPQIRDLLGISPAEYIARADTWESIVHPDDRERLQRDYESFVLTGVPESGDYRYVRADGSTVWVHDRSKLVRDANGNALFVQGVIFDITSQKESELRIQHMAYHDGLTGLPNRAMFEEHLALAIARAERNGSSVAVLFMDLDGFKEVNDSLGHAAGDDLLKVVAERLRQATRTTDLVARLGGDEFLVLLADLPDERGIDASAVLELVKGRIAKKVSRTIPVRGHKVVTTISIGAAMFPDQAADSEELMRLADSAMYAQKRRGEGARLVG